MRDRPASRTSGPDAAGLLGPAHHLGFAVRARGGPAVSGVLIPMGTALARGTFYALLAVLVLGRVEHRARAAATRSLA
ncbi:hypothetical protein [Streptomyces sp. NPDC060022]|uniref:hypothetical protein n=1 Tax=Streptomyces sp. NPDC060022 TaxID=3347039 RepID=UPI0036A85AD4